ncbi:MAG: hypothetical protein VCD00_16470, partial [Candidatus Hydrogenedentota bacterium]
MKTKKTAWHLMSVLFLFYMLSVTSSCSAIQSPDSSNPDLGDNHEPPVADGAYPPFGFTTFPYAATIEAIDRTHKISRENGRIYA